ncbi:MAG: nucleotidyl transferase AbiEii/AbiGii toxin family protein [Gloeobacteraceae cyanobacterium ES-bin-144]|nr:nucleotidyl transferase AbiEii/AbiGii toxin family protein [Verrucomicrobiales bacterium]
MLSELDLLLDVTRRLEKANFDYMLTGSMALNHYAQPRMTRDIDIVIALLLKDLETLPKIFGADFYFSPEAAHQAILNQSCFNVIHNDSLIKVDFMIRKREDYRLVEFDRRQRIEVMGQSLWIVSKEDLILSKLDWARDSQSQRQLADVENLLATGADKSYLQTWSQKLNLTDMLTRVSP